jgi:hypothetical protein
MKSNMTVSASALERDGDRVRLINQGRIRLDEALCGSF